MWRGALNLGSVAYAMVTIVIQTALIVLLALALGPALRQRPRGVLILILVAALLGAAFASLSNGIGMLARQRETLIGAVSLVLLPLTFLSSALMQQSLVPGWIRTVSKLNPVNWAVEAGRSAAMQKLDWGLVGQPRRPAGGPRRPVRGVRDARLRHLPALALRSARPLPEQHAGQRDRDGQQPGTPGERLPRARPRRRAQQQAADRLDDRRDRLVLGEALDPRRHRGRPGRRRCSGRAGTSRRR